MNTTKRTLEQVESDAGRALEGLGLLEAQGDGRVSGAPDGRTIRYYQTLGLVDRPSYEGREARYGERHVLQVVAIKLLQSLGLPLGEVQARLYGKSNRELEALLKAANEAAPRRAHAARPVAWREYTIEPGLKVMVEEGWQPRGESLAKIRSVLDSLAGGSKRNG
jgi:DNA-binding transcriptional MerR regulator